MATKSKKRFPCGHKGFGQFCHRCQRAEVIEALLEAKEPLITDKKKASGKPRKWKPEEMRAEAKRLREEGINY